MRYLFFAIALIFSSVAIAQNPAPPSPEMKAAGELMQQKKYADAANSYEQVLSHDPKNAAALYQLAMARYSLQQYRQAADAYERNIAITGNPFATYNLAGVYSLMGDKAKAIDTLEKAMNDPKMVVAVANFDDPDFANVRSEPKFAAIRDATDRKVRPCMYSDEAKQLNFWVGEWEVYNPQGRHDGKSSVQSFANGCGILENWTGTFGGDGKSINFYDPSTTKWYQYWMGAAGGPLRYSGIFRDKAMRYEGENMGPNGKKTLIRLTFFDVDPNTVRQFAENSTDDGKTWNVSYDYKYIRKK